MHDLIILGYADHYIPMFTELNQRENIHLIPPQWHNENELLRFLLLMRQSYKKQKTPFFPFHKFNENTFSKESNPFCYLFFRDWYPLFAAGYIKKLKELDPQTKACWFFSDLVETYPGIDIDLMRREFDLILSFDPEDAHRYNFVHCPLPYSALPEAENWQKEPARNSVCFMGTPKKRLSTLFAVYEYLRTAGIDCDFHLMNVPASEQRYVNEIHYCHFLPYRDYLKRTLSSQCILEILQDSSHHGYTIRTGEALLYGRKLLSNNTQLSLAPFYDPKQISTFSHPEKINIDFIKSESTPKRLLNAFSPQHTLQVIEERLNIRLL